MRNAVVSLAVFTVLLRWLVFATWSAGAESTPNPDNVMLPFFVYHQTEYQLPIPHPETLRDEGIFVSLAEMS